MASSISVLDSEGIALSEIDYGVVEPGEVKAIQVAYQNNSTSDIASAKKTPYPDLQSDSFTNDINVDGDSVTAMRVIRETAQGVMQTATIAKESAGAELTAFEQRVQVWEYIGGVWTERNTGSVNFMADPSDEIHIGCDERILNLRIKLATPGSYAGFNVKLSQEDGSYATPVGLVDGTSGLSVADGVIQIDQASAADWRKIKVNGKWVYDIKLICTAVTTQAISESDGVYWEYTYDLPKHFLAGAGKYYLKSDEATPTYTEVTPDYEYQNLGRIVFQDDPFATYPTYTLVCEITYKNPQSKVYQIDVVSVNTVTVTEDGGSPSSPINVSTTAGNKNTNIILGCEITLKTGDLAVGNRATVKISPMLKYLWHCLTDTYNSYINGDLTLGAISTGSSVDCYTKYIPALDALESENERYFNDYITGS